MEFRKAVDGLLTQVRECLTGSVPVSNGRMEAPKVWPPAPSVDIQPDQPWQRSGQHIDRSRARKNGEQRPHLRAEKELSLARAGKSGFFKLYPSPGEKVVFNIWVSPKDEHGEYLYKDRRGNPVRKLFPKTYYRDGEVLERISCKGKGPSLPIGILYGRSVDESRFAEEHREVLELFLGLIRIGVENYDALRQERKSMRKSA
jgi:hypothetical protein